MERVTRDELLTRIRTDRRAFDAILARVPADKLVAPILPGGWTVKDVLAHIAWGERESIGVVDRRALAGSELWELDQDERNAVVVEANRERPVDEVIADYRDTFERFVGAVGELSDDELNDPARFHDMEESAPGWLPWRILYDPDHYEEHGRTIEEHAVPADRELG